jgi:hypothetical protein
LVIASTNEKIEIRQPDVVRLEAATDTRTNLNYALICTNKAKSVEIGQLMMREVGQELALLAGCKPQKTIWNGTIREAIFGGCFQFNGQDKTEAAALVGELEKALRTGCGVY